MYKPLLPHVVASGTKRALRSRFAFRRRYRRLSTGLIYGGLLTAAALALFSHEIGTTWHSLLSVTVLGVIAGHIVSQRRWIKSVVRKRNKHPERKLAAFNATFAGTFLLANLSGLLLGFNSGGKIIMQVHNVSGIAFFLLVFVHLLLNRKRLSVRFRSGSHGVALSAARA